MDTSSVAYGFGSCMKDGIARVSKLSINSLYAFLINNLPLPCILHTLAKMKRRSESLLMFKQRGIDRFYSGKRNDASFSSSGDCSANVYL